MTQRDPNTLGELAASLKRHAKLLDEFDLPGIPGDTPGPTTARATRPSPTVPEPVQPAQTSKIEAPKPTPVAEPKGISPLRSAQEAPKQTASRPAPAPEPTPSSEAVAPKAERPVPQFNGPKHDALDELRAHIGDCARCPLSEQGRTNVVFGVGNPNADVMFVGEAPGFHEDKEGVPFVGRAGELLTRIIEQGMHLKRDEVYIANIIKCRPPSNRDPVPEEVATCRPFILKQIEIIQPKVIITLGRVALQALLQNQESISRVRGQWHELGGVPVMPTFHPAYLLRNPAGKRPVWNDIKAVLQRLNEA